MMGGNFRIGRSSLGGVELACAIPQLGLSEAHA